MDLLAARRRVARTGPNRWCEGWQAAGPTHPAGPGELEILEAVRRYVNFCLAVLFANRRRRCLPRSLVLYRWAGRLGLDASWHMAFHRTGTDRDGHSWVELAGEPLFEPPRTTRDFLEVYRYPPPAGAGRQ